MGDYILYDLSMPKPDMLEEILAGFALTPKRIQSKYFYNERGSRLFEAITRLPEYYMTRVELDILDTNKEEIVRAVGNNVFFIEFGSGSSTKIRILLESIRPKAYMPIDISKDHLEASAKTIAQDYSWLNVRAACADYSQQFDLPWSPEGIKHVAFFPGSSLGNFDPDEALAFLIRVRKLVGDTGGLLIGIDKQKSEHILHAAYNDASNTTKDFNLNMLEHINEALGADFIIDNFQHEAIYNCDESRIEMYLRSLTNQNVQIDGHQLYFHENERIATENSYKYKTSSFLDMASRAGFKNSEHWMDAKAYFSVFYLTP